MKRECRVLLVWRLSKRHKQRRRLDRRPNWDAAQVKVQQRAPLRQRPCCSNIQLCSPAIAVGRPLEDRRVLLAQKPHRNPTRCRRPRRCRACRCHKLRCRRSNRRVPRGLARLIAYPCKKHRIHRYNAPSCRSLVGDRHRRRPNTQRNNRQKLHRYKLRNEPDRIRKISLRLSAAFVHTRCQHNLRPVTNRHSSSPTRDVRKRHHYSIVTYKHKQGKQKNNQHMHKQNL